MREKKIFVDRIGKVLFVRKSKVKNISIRLYAEGRVKVTMPVYSSWSQAVKVVRSKTPWILKQREILIKRTRGKQIIINNNTVFPYLKHKIELIPHESTRGQIKIYNGILKILYPGGINIENKRIQDFIRKGITEAMRIEAKKFLPQRVEELAGKYGFSYRKVFVKNAKTLWGSCSSKNNINLNLNLMRLPEKLQDYVILHELVHTVHRNHGPQFWGFLDHYFGNARSMAKELKKYKIDEL